LELAQNPGAFMSLGADLPGEIRFWLFNIVTSMTLLFVAWLVLCKRDLHKGPLVGLTLILGGGIGNLIDRMLYGSVTDFLWLSFGSLKTGIFNVADLAIVAGVIIFLTMTRRHKECAPFLP